MHTELMHTGHPLIGAMYIYFHTKMHMTAAKDDINSLIS